MKIKKGDNVIVLAGKDRGKKGKVSEVLPREDKVLVEGVNKIKVRRRKREGEKDKGQIIEHERPVHVSNIALVDPKEGVATRIGYKVENGKKVRIAKKSNQEV